LEKKGSGNCQSSRNEKFEKLINNLEKNYHSIKDNSEKQSSVTEDDNSFYHLMLSNKGNMEFNRTDKESNLKTLDDLLTLEKVTTNSSGTQDCVLRKDKKKKKKKFIDIDKFGIINNDKYMALKEKNNFIDKDKLKLWVNGPSKDLSLNTLNSLPQKVSFFESKKIVGQFW
jgi:hypothetical protein